MEHAIGNVDLKKKEKNSPKINDNYLGMADFQNVDTVRSSGTPRWLSQVTRKMPVEEKTGNICKSHCHDNCGH